MLSLLLATPMLSLGGRAAVPAQRTCAPAMKLADDGILGVGVIGAGRIGLVHLEALAQCETARAVIISRTRTNEEAPVVGMRDRRRRAAWASSANAPATGPSAGLMGAMWGRCGVGGEGWVPQVVPRNLGAVVLRPAAGC